ncbi:MAG TPA: hypothetical protein VHU18_00710 [Rhizomicrobium sp.]|jgi:hypothetical protein|nr:hypothetical protein [Rhizomicrobium sp.]
MRHLLAFTPNQLRKLIVMLIALGAASAPATSAFGSFTLFDVPGADYTSALSINSSGVVVGFAGYNPETPFVRTPDGAITEIPVPGVSTALAVSVNDEGAVARWGCDGTCVDFIRTPDGSLITFNPDPNLAASVQNLNEKEAVLGNSQTYPTFVRQPDGSFSYIAIDLGKGTQATTGTFINDKGVVTGYVERIVRHVPGTAASPKRKLAAFGFARDRKGGVTIFQGPNSSLWTLPGRINNKGRIAGNYIDPATGKGLGFLRLPDGSLTTIDIGDGPVVEAINDSGVIVGRTTNDGRSRGFIRHPNGKISYFDAQEGRSFTTPTSINNDGEIAGDCVDPDGVQHGFIGTP